MLLVTGPTGSGKTTTLYAVISEANKGLDKIITIEDPVEYQLPGVLQIPVNEQKGLSFARGLRSILRHDPDRIMVGEIRDPETAEIAVQSALTGHLVYTTVHANNAIDVLGRFQHMGVDTYNLVSALNGVVAQRLVRVLCKACRGKGCAECRNTGFKGSKAIGELLVLNDELRELITARAPAKAQGGGACRGNRPAARRGAGAGRGRRNHSRGDQSCHFRGLGKNRCASAWGRRIMVSGGKPVELASGDDWRGAVERAARAAQGAQGRRGGVVLADQFARYALLPHNDAVKSAEQWPRSRAIASARCTARSRPSGK